MIVEIRAPDVALVPQWDGLIARANPNVFMHPAALAAAAAAGFAKVHVLLAWHGDTLAGLWALRERRVACLPAFLASPPYAYSFVGCPVINPDHAGAVMPAFLDAIAREPALPNAIQLKALDGDSVAFRAMMSALGTRPVLTLSEFARPFLGGESERKRSGSTGKKLRQDWNRLSALGAVEVVNDRSPDAVREAFEIFLALEARGWKGDSGTALLSRDADAAFARRWIGALARHGAASVALLRVNDRPIATQVLLTSGTTAYTWKTAFDAEFARFSPGALLVDKVTDALFASGITKIESCSRDGGFMAQLWSGRRKTVDLLIDVGARRSAGFFTAAVGERAYAFAREQRVRLRGLSWPSPKRKNLAVTRG
jgi:CelD/BcsL family acetyltransferase involved in cellulose biosynthesis